MPSPWHCARLVAVWAVCAQLCTAHISQNSLYSDYMVLESRENYDIRPFIAGFGDRAGEHVSVHFMGGTYETEVQADKTWEVQMNSCNARGHSGPLNNETLTVQGEDNTLVYNHVACGQVFVCSGQSNMALELSYVNGHEQYIAGANRPNWRLFQVPLAFSPTPQSKFQRPTGWYPSTSEDVGNFSAVCFLTAWEISEMYWGDYPIGLIESAWGGTRVEAWAPAATQQACPMPAPAEGPVAPVDDQQSYSQLYNAMIHPLTRYSLRAAIWFQGEHNVVTHSSRQEYACVFSHMINGWRDAWRGIGDFPFLFVQLCSYTGYAPFAGRGDISVVRLAQADTLPHIGVDTTGMAVSLDQGDPKAPLGDVHSRNKVPVAHRLALQAMHVLYAFQEGENVSNPIYPDQTPNPFELHYSGPRLSSAVLGGATTATLAFEFGDGMFLNDTAGCAIHRGISPDGRVIGGQCCAAKDTFQLCTGDLTNTSTLTCTNATTVDINKAAATVTLSWAPAPLNGAAPTAVRHAYANYPQCALYNQYGLPAGTFVAPLTGPPPSAARTAPATEPRPLAGQLPSGPPMGWNSWNGLHCNVDERKLRAAADFLKTSGLHKLGYEYVNIDDCWQVERMPNGTIRVDPSRFPGGMKPLIDYIHSLGLKFGWLARDADAKFHWIYSAQREFTCQGRPGSWEHEAQDVEVYAEWGVDYIKLDQCRGRSWPELNTSWVKFRAAIDHAAAGGHPMVLSVESCDDPDGCGMWIGKLANLWRTSGDIQATFGSVLANAASNTKMAALAKPTGGPLGGPNYNDADMLQVGNVGLLHEEQVTHFSLWAIMASPLLIGTDLTLLSNESLAILSNGEVTAINQDAKGVQGVPVGGDARTAACWSKPLADGSVAALLINVNATSATISCRLSDLGIPSGRAKQARDLWGHKDLGPQATVLTTELDSHACAMYRLTPDS